MLEKTLESNFDCKEIKPVNPKGNQSWIFIERTDAEAEVPIIWPPDVNSWLIRKAPDARKDWRQGEKRTTKDWVVGWHHWLSGHELGQVLGHGEGQGILTCFSTMDYTVHEILQARILEWVAFPFSRGYSQSRDWTQVSYIVGGFFTSWDTRDLSTIIYLESSTK